MVVPGVLLAAIVVAILGLGALAMSSRGGTPTRRRVVVALMGGLALLLAIASSALIL